MDINTLVDLLKKNGHRITEQRLSILNILILHKNSLFSVEEILNKVNKINPSINQSTVYRNLEKLEKLNLVHRVITDDGLTLYKLICSDHHHHHFICKACGKTEVIDYCPIDHYNQIIKEKNYVLIDHKIELFGYCDKCLKTG